MQHRETPLASFRIRTYVRTVPYRTSSATGGAGLAKRKPGTVVLNHAQLTWSILDVSFLGFHRPESYSVCLGVSTVLFFFAH